MRQGKAYIITGCSGPRWPLVMLRPAKPAYPFAVIGTRWLIVVSAANLDDRRRQYQRQIIAIYIAPARAREFLRMPLLHEFIHRDIAALCYTVKENYTELEIRQAARLSGACVQQGIP